MIQTDNAPEAIGPYVQAMKIDPLTVGHLIYTSGQIPLTPDGGDEKLSADIKVQTKQVLENLKAVLEEAGSALHHVVKTTVYLADMEDFAQMNAVYSEYFSDHKPARSAVAVKTIPKNAKVEIEAIAIKVS